MGRKTREPHSCITAGYDEAPEATGLPGVTALMRRWVGPRTLGGRGRPAGGSRPEGAEDHSERSPRHAEAPAHATATCDQPDQPSRDHLKAHHFDDANPILAVPSQRFSSRPQRPWLTDWPARVNSSIAMGIKQGPGALRSGTSRAKPRSDLLDARRKAVRKARADAVWPLPIG
jgi:hypothetical protein